MNSSNKFPLCQAHREQRGFWNLFVFLWMVNLTSICTWELELCSLTLFFKSVSEFQWTVKAKAVWRLGDDNRSTREFIFFLCSINKLGKNRYGHQICFTLKLAFKVSKCMFAIFINTFAIFFQEVTFNICATLHHSKALWSPDAFTLTIRIFS